MSLVITREPKQSVRIGEAVVKVDYNSRGQIRLIIDAPKSVPIVRTELEKGAA